MLTPAVQRAVSLALSLLAIGAYALMHGVTLWKTYTYEVPAGVSQTLPANLHASESFAYIQLALAGLVGGIVAVAFGIPKQHDGQQKNGVQTALHSLNSRIGLDPANDHTTTVAATYVIAYVVVGLLCVVMWVLKPWCPSDVKNSAVTFAGVALAIVSSFLNPKPN